MRRIHHIFNEKSFSPKRYARLQERLTGAYGLHGIKVCETPVFLGRAFTDKLTTAAQEMVAQCMQPDTLKELDKAVPDKFRVPNVPEKPPFLIVDFAITRDEQTGGLKPQLIELQACSSVMAYLADAAQLYKDTYRLDKNYTPFPAQKGEKDFKRALQKAVLGTHDPENVVLLEIEPAKQKTQFDFLATQKYLGVKTVDVTDIEKHGNKLFYRDDAQNLVQIHRIYNRIAPDEFEAKGLADKAAFKFTDALDVEWAGDPVWDFRISKYALPYIDHEMCPKTHFLKDLREYPKDLENYILKPLFNCGGAGVDLNVTAEKLDNIRADRRDDYVLMRKVQFTPFIPAPKGGDVKAEVRVMMTWTDTEKPKPMIMMARVMRGDMANASFNQSDSWVGIAPVLVVEEGRKPALKSPRP